MSTEAQKPDGGGGGKMDERLQLSALEIHEVHEMQRSLGDLLTDVRDLLKGLTTQTKQMGAVQKVLLPACLVLSSSAFAWTWRTEGRVTLAEADLRHLSGSVVTDTQLERLRADLLGHDNPQIGLLLNEVRVMSERLVRVETRLDRQTDKKN